MGKEKRIKNINEVYKIRKNVNPEVSVAPPNVCFVDLEGKTYQEIVEIFEARILDRYIKIAESLDRATLEGREQWSGANFAITILCCVIIDMLSQYVYAAPASEKMIFKQFFREWLKQINHKIEPPIETCYYSKGNWFKEAINDVADAFYHCFRCGIVHSGRILEYGRINPRYPDEIIRVVTWDEKRNNREINVNPAALVKKIREVFMRYIEKLKANESVLKQNFVKKFKMEYGIEIQDRK